MNKIPGFSDVQAGPYSPLCPEDSLPNRAAVAVWLVADWVTSRIFPSAHAIASLHHEYTWVIYGSQNAKTEELTPGTRHRENRWETRIVGTRL